MKRVMLVFTMALVVSTVLFGCSGGLVPDYTTDEFEAALNNGEDMTGKTVAVEVKKIEPSSAFGYNLQAGEHLNFVSSSNPGVEAGDTVVVKVEKVASAFGSFIITYTR